MFPDYLSIESPSEGTRGVPAVEIVLWFGVWWSKSGSKTDYVIGRQLNYDAVNTAFGINLTSSITIQESLISFSDPVEVLQIPVGWYAPSLQCQFEFTTICCKQGSQNCGAKLIFPISINYLPIVFPFGEEKHATWFWLSEATKPAPREIISHSGDYCVGYLFPRNCHKIWNAPEGQVQISRDITTKSTSSRNYLTGIIFQSVSTTRTSIFKWWMFFTEHFNITSVTWREES